MRPARLMLSALCTASIALAADVTAQSQSTYALSLTHPRTTMEDGHLVVTFAVGGELSGLITLALDQLDPSAAVVSGKWSLATYQPMEVPLDRQVSDEPGEPFDPGPPVLSGTLAGNVPAATLVTDAQGTVIGVHDAQLRIESGSLRFGETGGDGVAEADGIDAASAGASLGTLHLALSGSNP